MGHCPSSGSGRRTYSRSADSPSLHSEGLTDSDSTRQLLALPFRRGLKMAGAIVSGDSKEAIAYALFMGIALNE